MLGGLKAWRLGGLELQEMGIGFGVSYHYRVLILVSLDWIAGVG